MAIPTAETCFALMEQHRMLDNIRRHSCMVAAVALELTVHLDRGPERDLVLAGALLHDIAKTPCLESRCDHAQRGAEICLEYGFDEIAPIVAQHVILQDFQPERYQLGTFNAAEIVYYADKRVRHEEVVSLEARLDYIITQYGKNNPRLHQIIRENFARCRELEKHLFSHLSFSPASLERELTPDHELCLD